MCGGDLPWIEACYIVNTVTIPLQGISLRFNTEATSPAGGVHQLGRKIALPAVEVGKSKENGDDLLSDPFWSLTKTILWKWKW